MPRQLKKAKSHRPECAFSWMNTPGGYRNGATDLIAKHDFLHSVSYVHTAAWLKKTELSGCSLENIGE